MIYFFIVHAIISIAGGLIAYRKSDYFTRGFFICLFTSIFGLIAIIVSPKSCAKKTDEVDTQYWPEYSIYAVFATLITVILYLLF